MTSSLSSAALPRRSAVGAPPPRDECTVDGVRLAYNDDGAGPPVVCLHAIGHGAGDFIRLREGLRAHHRVLALDWPGQGCSGPDHLPASAPRYADLLAGFLDATGVERAVLVGNSIGGAAALRLAAARPERVSGLVLLNPGGLAPIDPLAHAAIATLVRFFTAGARGARWFPPAFAAYYRLILQRSIAAPQRRRIVASAYEIAPVLLEAWRSFAEPAADLRALAPRITCPVLFAWAARDQLVQLRRSRAAIRSFPHGHLETFPAGNAPHLETPDAFEASLARFLSDLAAPRSPRVAAGL